MEINYDEIELLEEGIEEEPEREENFAIPAEDDELEEEEVE